MALVVTISYSMSHTNSTNPADDNATFDDLDSVLRLELAPGSNSHAAFSSTTSATVEANSVLISNENLDIPTKRLSQLEYTQGLRAGERAIKDRLSADVIAAKSPLPSLSPESRHRHAMSTYSNVSALALAAVGEIAATRTIEKIR